MAFNFKNINTNQFFVADTNYGTVRDNVLPNDMPDEISKHTGMGRSIATGSSLDPNAMTEVVAQTCTAAFHKRKGYIDSAKQSAITYRELLKLFDVKSGTSPKNIHDKIMEFDDYFVYIHSGSYDKEIVINPADFRVQSEDHIISVLVNQDVIDLWARKKEYRVQCEKIFERLTSSKSKKPILVFNWVDSVTRGEHLFPASAILRKLEEDGFEKILQFNGAYTLDHEDRSGRLIIQRNNSRFDF